MVRKGNGRRKVEMAKIKNESNLQVTFSKRKLGLFKKASELCTLCDAQIALIIFSPSGKVYSFGHPDHLLLAHSSGGLLTHNHPTLDQTNRKTSIQMLNDQFTEVMARTETEQRKKATIVQNETKNKNPDNWWRNSPNELSLTQLICMKHALEDLKRDVDAITYQSLQTKPNYYVGSSSNAAPAIFNGGHISANPDFFDQNGMTTPSHTLPLGFNAMNRPPAWYNHSQIQNQEFNQAHPHHGPRYW